jgi:hypothetical protein
MKHLTSGWIYSFLKKKFTTTPIPSHSPFSCSIPKKLQVILHSLIKPGYQTRKFRHPLNCLAHPSLHTQWCVGLIPQDDRKSQCIKKQWCMNKVSWSLWSETYKCVSLMIFLSLFPSPLVWSTRKVMWTRMVIWNECQCMDWISFCISKL